MVDCTLHTRGTLAHGHLSAAQGQSDRRDSNADGGCHKERNMSACNLLRLHGEQAHPGRSHQQSATGGDKPQTPQECQATTSPLNEEERQQYGATNEDDEDILHLEKDDKSQVNSSKVCEGARDLRRKYYLDSTMTVTTEAAAAITLPHLDQSNTTSSSPSEEYNLLKNHCHSPHQNQPAKVRYQSQPSRNLTHTNARRAASKQLRCHSITANLPGSILTVIVVNAILSHLAHIIHLGQENGGPLHPLQLFAYPNIVRAEIECNTEYDCKHPDKTCYENKCICKRARPIEDKEHSECLPHAALTEPCSLSEQCIGNSICTDGYCSCPLDHVDIFNPSTKLKYCHPKRRLREECNYDNQCPENAFCSTQKQGCLCQNGYGASLVRIANEGEQTRCLRKSCRVTSDCESEFHICHEGLCMCLGTHFDPHTAECYKFGSTGGELGHGPPKGNTTMLDGDDASENFINDLMRNGDKLWLIVIILAISTLVILVILIMLLRKHYLGYCWTHTKEYEPNNDNSPRSGQFNKNSINNKSFRKKSSELDDDDDEEAGSGTGGDDSAADRSNLVTGKKRKNGALMSDSAALAKRNGTDNENPYVHVDMRSATNLSAEADDSGRRSPSAQYHRTHHQVMSRPLPSSTSTPV